MPELTTLLSRLAAEKIKFVLVGGLAAVAQGAPITTFDVDIVHARDEENLARLLPFLNSIHALFRGLNLERRIPPTAEHLRGKGHCLLVTDLGPLDVLGAIEDDSDYRDLVPSCIPIEIEGHEILVLSLSKIVEFKRKSTSPKDQAMLPVLEATLKAQ
jgi:hypothetical protein